MATFTYTNAPENVTSGGGSDKFYMSGGNDTIDAGAGNDTIYAGDGDDLIYGGDGDDQLTGGNGVDTMYGGDGNDTYMVTDIGDLVIEDTDGGFDTVQTTLQNYTLTANVENLILAGSGDINGRGNDLANGIKGNAGKNTLDGRGGNDSIQGLGGNDIIYGSEGNDVMNGGDGSDVITFKQAAAGVTVDLAISGPQNTGQGLDTLISFENLEGSTFNDTLLGDSGANVIQGLGGDDTIRGRAGNDTVAGSGGADTFIFESTATNGTDVISGGFVSGVDKLQFFAADGYSAAFAFTTGAAAVTAGPEFIHNTANKSLSYDADGTGSGAAVILAYFLPDGPIAAGDIVVV